MGPQKRILIPSQPDQPIKIIENNMCGGCGGGVNRAQNVRKQVIKPEAAPAKKQPILRHIPRAAARPNKVEVQRQYVVPRQTCPKCGYPAMTVNIANRERYQCSNSNCRTVIR